MTASLSLLALAILSATDPTVARPTPAAEKIHCIRTEVTGSLAGRAKECHTAAEWQRRAAAVQDESIRVFDKNTTSCGATGPGQC